MQQQTRGTGDVCFGSHGEAVGCLGPDMEGEVLRGDFVPTPPNMPPADLDHQSCTSDTFGGGPRARFGVHTCPSDTHACTHDCQTNRPLPVAAETRLQFPSACPKA